MSGKFLLVVGLVVLPLQALAQNVGQCGWGSKLFEGDKGIAPQVLAATTNGTFGNQTFGISSGTSGCTQDGVVRSSWRTAAYIDGNMNKLARDMSRGEGESLEALAALVGVLPEDRVEFASILKQNYGSIFSSAHVSSNEVTRALHETLAADARLAKYSKSV